MSVTSLVEEQSPPHYLDALSRRHPRFGAALATHRDGRLDAARAAYLDLVDEPALSAVALHQLALVAGQTGDDERAIALFRAAIRFDPRQPIFHRNLAATLQRLKRMPETSDALMELVVALQGAGQFARAAEVCRHVLAADAARCDALFALGASLLALGEPAAAVTPLVQGLARAGAHLAPVRELLAAVKPRLAVSERAGMETPVVGAQPSPAAALETALTTLGMALGRLGHDDLAIGCYRVALELDPMHAAAHFNLGMALLRGGISAEGWREYEWRWQWAGFPERRRLPGRVWRGQDLAGRTVLVATEQGLGDAIQFAPLVRRLDAAAHVILEVPPPLVRLFATNLATANIEVVARDPGEGAVATARPIDYAVSLMSLPARLGLGAEDLPLAAGYLAAPAAAVAAWSPRLAPLPRPRIGIAWAGSPTHTNDRIRSVALPRLRRLFDGLDVGWVSLQAGPRAGDVSGMARPILTLADELGDFADTAAMIANLDMVVTVDTAVAHLAAAMGKPTFIMLAADADWRWMRERGDSPWYPSVRLVRQPAADAWEAVADEVAAVLGAVVPAMPA